MFTWLLLPFGLSLTLTFSGPTVTGPLDGVGVGPCPVTGALDGQRVGLTAICVTPGHSLGGFLLVEKVEAIPVLLNIDPETLGGTWRIGFSTGPLQPR